MFIIKRRNLLFLLIVTFIFGASVPLAVIGVTNKIFDETSISGKEYREYQAYKISYGKLLDFDSYIRKNYYLPIGDGILENGAYKGQFSSLGDIYTVYYTAEEFKRQNERTQGEFSGIGAYLLRNDEGEMVIERVMEGGAAEKGGLRSGDVVVLIDGNSYMDLDLSQAVEYLRGSDGSNVELHIRRGTEEFDVVLTRSTVVMPSVNAFTRDDGIGYIQVTAFSRHTAEEFGAKLSEMEAAQVKGLIIDLRDNLGGIVEQGVEIADMLLEAGKVATLRYGNGEEKIFNSREGATKLPYVVLINHNSASTSEILAGAIQDNKGGYLVGDVTTGKGIVQKLESFRGGDGARITIAQYFTPDDHPVHGIGIKPDFEVEQTEDGSRDVQVEKAVELLSQTNPA